MEFRIIENEINIDNEIIEDNEDIEMNIEFYVINIEEKCYHIALNMLMIANYLRVVLRKS